MISTEQRKQEYVEFCKWVDSQKLMDPDERQELKAKALGMSNSPGGIALFVQQSREVLELFGYEESL